METIVKIALGGGCHWCTEAVFQSLKGVILVEQGWICADDDSGFFSEGVIVHFQTEEISLHDLIQIHLNTHSSTSNHSMRKKYRSAIYAFSELQQETAVQILKNLQSDFDKMIVTQVLRFKDFKLSGENFLNYYRKNPNKPFCESYISPKLIFLLKRFKEKFTKLN